MTFMIWTLLIAIITAVTCSLCGVYLVVKKEAMLSEGLSHAVLPGIIIGFLVFQERSSPWLIVGAALMGLLMVFIVGLIKRTRLVDDDASLGIVFSAMFSVGVILSSQNLRNIHFHPECIIDGNLNLAALQTWRWGELDLGPTTFWIMLGTLLLVVLFIVAFYKELKVMAFDESLASAMGLRPDLVHGVWLALVSLTFVTAFETAGSILVVALMIAPPAAAYLLTKNLLPMLVLSGVLACLSSLIGFYIGYAVDVSPTGPIAFTSGMFFLFVVLFAPGQGLCSRWLLRCRQRSSLFEQLLLSQLSRGADESMSLPNGLSEKVLYEQVNWSRRQFRKTLRRCLKCDLVFRQGGRLGITETGVSHLRKEREFLVLS